MPKENESFNNIRSAISTLLKTNTQENREKAKKCIEMAVQDGTIHSHLKTLHQDLDNHAKNSQGTQVLLVTTIRSWLHQASPPIEISKENEQCLIQELQKEEPSVQLIQQYLHRVTTFKLTGNQLRATGAQAFAEALKSNT